MNTKPTRVDTYDPATINISIASIWNEYFTDATSVRSPHFYGPLAKHALVYVGVNPSFSIPAIERIAHGTEYEGIDVDRFFSWDTAQSNLSHIDNLIRFEEYAIEKYPAYFKPMRDLATSAGLQPQPLDVFLYRCTSQKEFADLVFLEGKLNTFGEMQFRLFKDVLTRIQPTVIVVANAFASRILREGFKEDVIFDEDQGFHTLLIQGERTPIFFSSMLTGQRALDLGSYERLKWHVGKAAQFVVSQVHEAHHTQR